MAETRKLAAILAADVVGYSRLAGADEDGTVARLRALRSELIDPAIAGNRGPHRQDAPATACSSSFASVVDAVRCAIEVQNEHGRAQCQAPPEAGGSTSGSASILAMWLWRADGDLMGDGVNIAARLEGIAKPGGICLSEEAYRQVRDKTSGKLYRSRRPGIEEHRRPMRVYAVQGSRDAPRRQHTKALRRHRAASPPLGPVSLPPRLSIVVLPFANIGGDPEQEYFVDGVTESLTTDLSRISGSFVIAPQHGLHLQRQTYRREADRPRTRGALCTRRLGAARRQSHARQCPAHRRRDRQPPMGRALRQAGGRSLRHAGRDCRAACQSIGHTVDRGRSAARATGTASRLDGPLFSGHG